MASTCDFYSIVIKGRTPVISLLENKDGKDITENDRTDTFALIVNADHSNNPLISDILVHMRRSRFVSTISDFTHDMVLGANTSRIFYVIPELSIMPSARVINEGMWNLKLESKMIKINKEYTGVVSADMSIKILRLQKSDADILFSDRPKIFMPIILRWSDKKDKPETPKPSSSKQNQ